ncbi:11595_t:CDS:10 [Paraglomus brasilianum]|uniref:11595_t:CDS:1 n=1 Tax=Paraglomus brasilianum TaxID=144538 RepID=A0A9N9BFM7_9GLOM|nr:11595_t:CDS:10 [Paraglomus brasilianum]
MTNTAYAVNQLLEKMDSSDTDFRYMATNDLMNELQKDVFTIDEPLERKVVAKILILMNDANGEVQNLAVKCLAPLVKKVHEPQLQEIVDRLCDYTTQKKDELRDIAGIGLKTVMIELPNNPNLVNNILSRLVPRLIQQLENPDTPYEVLTDTLDILSEILSRFGLSVAKFQKRIQKILLTQLQHSRPAFRKKVTIAMGHLVVHISDELFNELITQILMEFNMADKQHERLKTLIQCVGTLSRSSAPRLGKYLPEFVPHVLRTSSVDDDELREICLQALETFVLRCPTEVTQDYSDDDDMSWKVRRSSSKLLAAIIGTRHEILVKLYLEVAPALVSRFNEREESVRVDVLHTFIILLRQTFVYGGDSYVSREGEREAKRRKASAEMDTEESPKQLLRGLIPKLSRILSKQLQTTKSIPTKQMGFVLLRELVTVLNGGLEQHINLFIPVIENALTTSLDANHHSNTNSNLKIETLSFLRQLLRVHAPHVLHQHLDRLSPPITASVSDKFYKITSEALIVCIELVKVIRPIGLDQSNIPELNPHFKKYIINIYEETNARLAKLDADQEVKERAIMCLGTLLSQTGDNLQEQLSEAMPKLLSFLKNEVTRLTTVKTFTSVADSSVCFGSEVRAAVLQAVGEVGLLLRKTHRQLKVASLICLEVFVRRYGADMDRKVYDFLLKELTPHISDQDLHLLPLALNTIVAILNADPSTAREVDQYCLPAVFQLVQSTLVQGAALHSLLKLFATLIKTDEERFDVLLAKLREPVELSLPNQLALSKQAYSTIAQCITVLCVESSPDIADDTVNDFIEKIQIQETPESITYLSLLTLGEIGRRVDLSSHTDIHQSVLQLFSASSEEVKSAAAFALGNISVGNVRKYLPIVISEIKNDPKKRYLLLHALKEIITRYSNEEGIKDLGPFAESIWNILFDSGEGVEEGTRNVVAECVGKLTMANPNTFLPELQKRLKSSSAETRGTVVTAIKYTFANEGQDYDELLRPLIMEFLLLIRDSDLNVRRLSLSTFNSAAHNKPYLIRDVLNQLLPLLYNETYVNPDLIRTVEMGPFQHQVDGGLDIRKSAYECMHTLLETCLDKLDIFRFLDRVLAGLTDHHDIIFLSHTMLIRLANIAPTAVKQKLDDTVDPLKTILNTKLKENAVKAEVERNNELQRSALRVIIHLSALLETAGHAPKFEAMTREVKHGQLSNTYKNLVTELENKDYSTRVDAMDLS